MGWPANFSADAGDTPRRSVMNQRFREQDGAVHDGIVYGVLPYDADIDYVQYAKVGVGTSIYVAQVANGPDTGNVTDPSSAGQTVWITVAGSISTPNAPAAPTATEHNGRLDFSWNCPRDNGAEITAFDFQWRVTGTSMWERIHNRDDSEIRVDCSYKWPVY